MVAVTMIAVSMVLSFGWALASPPSTFIEGRASPRQCELAHSYGAGAVGDLLPIAVLVSGAGTNLQALIDRVHRREAEIVAVASSMAGAPALSRAEAAGVPAEVFAHADYAERAARDEALGEWLAQCGARLVVLAGFMELLGAPFLARFAGRVINVHPSLLPAFPGLRAIEQALDYGVEGFGGAGHFVRPGVGTRPVTAQPGARSPRRGAAAA